VSALLFGNRHKLELLTALANAEDGRVNLSLLATAQGVPASVYYGPIRTLIDAGLVQRLAPQPHDRHRWYGRTESPLWACIRALVGELAAVEVKAS
jgi:hypothetical protein